MKIKSICCIGAGYVGGPTMSVIALKCPNIKVIVVDENENKIDHWNSEDLSKLPVFEPGLDEIIKKTRNRNLFFSKKIDEAIINSDMIFVAVNTPTQTSGEGAGMASDLKYVENAARRISEVSISDKIVVEKSTLPVRTAEKIKEILSKNKKISFEVLSNPEFLAEGTAIQDLFKSDRVLIGGDNTKSGKEAIESLKEIYLEWISPEKILTLNVWSSELSKLASNAFLAQRISSINSLSALCEKTGADIDEVSMAVGMDHRIGSNFLKVSPGFGGSCFQKDILNLVYICRHYNLDEVANFWEQVIKINDFQRERIVNKIEDYINLNSLKKEVSILGWAFKKNTNDSRESSSIYVTLKLLEKKYFVRVYDPMVNSEKIKKDLVEYSEDKDSISTLFNQRVKVYSKFEEIIRHQTPIVILTEWDEFLQLNNYSDRIIFDFRNIINKDITTYRL